MNPPAHASVVQELCITCCASHKGILQRSLFAKSSPALETTLPAVPCRRVHDRSITHLAYLPDHGTVLALSWDTTLRAFDVATSHCRYTATNDNGCPFTGMVHDVLHMQVG